jgi:hypothetical protein
MTRTVIADQLEAARSAASDFAESVIERAPEVLNAVVDDIRGGPPGDDAVRFASNLAKGLSARLQTEAPKAKAGLESALKRGEQIIDGLPTHDEVRHSVDDAWRQSRARADQVARTLPGANGKSTRTRFWRRVAILGALGVGVGLALGRVFRSKGPEGEAGSSVPTQPDGTEDRPADTKVLQLMDAPLAPEAP